jgi:hypothetical protein
MAANTKKAATAAPKQDAPKSAAKPEPRAKPEPAKTEPVKPEPPAKPRPAVPVGRPLFRDQDGKARQVGIVVLVVQDRHATGHELAGLPRTLTLLAAYPVSGHTEAAKLARDAGLLDADQDAVTVNGRFMSAVDVPAAETEAPAELKSSEPPQAA